MKKKLIDEAISEAQRAQAEPWTSPPKGPVKEIRLPPMLPIGDGQHLPATERLVSIVSEYSNVLLDNEPELKVRFKKGEFIQMAQSAFGQALVEINLDQPTAGLVREAKNVIESKIQDAIENNRKKLKMVLGLSLIHI